MSKNRNSAESRPAWRRKQYWQSLEERENSAFADQNQPEFPRSPDEMTAESRELASKGTSRKNFLKFMGAGAVLATASCRRPTERIVPAVIQPPEIVPGVATHYSSVSPDGTGVILRTRAGRPVKIQGNPDHPLSNGGVSAFNVAGLMDLYDPDRLRRPVEIKEGKKLRTDIRRVLPLVANALKTRGPYVLLTGAVDSPSTRALINGFLKSVPGGKH
ncbi:MAG: TAT-variant-translocated molybdopterin oxidoreductase, partial [Leptospiraceae bacterium]|nr:TAT-variant-translocated molybdopterin oxidoreductase [Leptospiraceae bacterium]